MRGNLALAEVRFDDMVRLDEDSLAIVASRPIAIGVNAKPYPHPRRDVGAIPDATRAAAHDATQGNGESLVVRGDAVDCAARG